MKKTHLIAFACLLTCHNMGLAQTNAKSTPTEENWQSCKQLLLNADFTPPESYQCAYRQTRESLLLEEPVVSTGTIFSNILATLWREDGDNGVEMRYSAETLDIYYPELGEIERYPMPEDMPTVAQVANPSPYIQVDLLPLIAEHFNVSSCEQEGTQWQLIISAKEDSPLLDHISSVEWSFDSTTGVIAQISIEDPYGDLTHITFADVHAHEVTNAQTSLSAPEGTPVIEPLAD